MTKQCTDGVKHTLKDLLNNVQCTPTGPRCTGVSHRCMLEAGLGPYIGLPEEPDTQELMRVWASSQVRLYMSLDLH